MTKKFVLDKSSETRRNLHTHTHTGKFCLAIISCFFIISINPTFADTQQIDIAPGANVLCNAALLGATSGTVRLRANFVPEDIDLKWYDGNTRVNTTSASNTCTYDTSINLPSNPTKTGYTFKGWKVRPEYDFAILASNGNGIDRYSKNEDLNSHVAICLYGEGEHPATQVDCNSNNRFIKLQKYEWLARFNWGNIYGFALCSITSGTIGNTGTPNESHTGRYCWCKATGYTTTEDSVVYAPSADASWVLFYDEEYNTTCASYCANRCAGRIQLLPELRSVLLGQ